MKDVRLEKMADVVVNYSQKIKKGDRVLINASHEAQPLILEVYKAVLRAGGHPEIHLSFEGAYEALIKEGNTEQLEYMSPMRKMAYETYESIITISGSKTTKPLAGLDPERIAVNRKSQQGVFAAFLKRMADGEVKWTGTMFPTYSAAQEADMTLEDYEEFVFNACLVNEENPKELWNEIFEKQEKIAAFLNTKKSFRFVSEGTDLILNTEGRRWINCAGQENFPDGEIFTTPIKESVNGTISFSYPSIYDGNEFANIKFVFENGKVVNEEASKGAVMLEKILDTDEGSRFVGEIAIGTNYGIQRFTNNTLFDEKIGGTIHLALGAGLPETGGNNISAVHWDLVNDMKSGSIYADGELIYSNGAFLEGLF